MQIWLIAAPPEVKFATIACVTDGGKGDTPCATTPWLPAKTATSGWSTCGRAEPCQPGQEGRNLLEPPERAGRLGELRLPLPRRGDSRLVRPRHLVEQRADVVEGAGGEGHVSLHEIGSGALYKRKWARRRKE